MLGFRGCNILLLLLLLIIVVIIGSLGLGLPDFGG